MRQWLEHFTLYDVIGYFAVGIVSYLGSDLILNWPIHSERFSRIWCFVSNLNAYQAGLVGIAAYMLGQVLGSISQFIYFKVPGVKKIPCHNYPDRAWKDWEGLRNAILDGYAREHLELSAGRIFWLCVAYTRERAPVTYGDAFKWLVYSGASRTLSLVSLSLSFAAMWHREWALLSILLVLFWFFYYTFYRMLDQYHKEVINSALLLISDRLGRVAET